MTYTTFYPEDVADRLEYLIKNDNERNKKIKAGLDYVGALDWEKSARKLEKIIIDRLEGSSFIDSCNGNTHKNNVKASVVIPVKNGGARFIDVIDSVLRQRTPWYYEVIILDSESDDDSLEHIPKLENIYIYTIPKSQFNHGETRNFGACKANGEFIVFLTHDAIPANEWWLYNMVTHLEHYPNAAGAFGKHVAHEESGYFTTLEIDSHFSQFENYPLFLSNKTKKANTTGYQQWQQILHYFSDNNSCMKRDILLKIPFRNVKYGEDQLWALDAIASGYGKVYTPSSIVRHSHEYDIETTYNRAKIDAAYFKFFFGYELIDSEDELFRVSESYKKDIMITCYEKMLPDELGEKQIAIINARLKGYFDGRLESQFFEISNNTRSQF